MHHYTGFAGQRHHRNKTELETKQYLSTGINRHQHAMSSENLTKNFIMRSQESLESQPLN